MEVFQPTIGFDSATPWIVDHPKSYTAQGRIHRPPVNTAQSRAPHPDPHRRKKFPSFRVLQPVL